MSYLDDQELTPEELQALQDAEKFHIQSELDAVPRSLVPAYNTGHLHYVGNRFLPSLLNDYIKIDIRRNSNSFFIISSKTNEHLQKLIQSRFGMSPMNKYLICTSITIVPCPNQVCSLYYHSGRYIETDHPKFKLISSFLAKPFPVKYSIACPFSDSKTKSNHCIFNWLRNNEYGDIAPATVISKYTLPETNQSMPWIMPEPYGAYMITGITDAIGFHCTFILNDNYTYRQSPRYTRYYVPRQRIGGDRPGEVGYEIPSQEFYQDNAQEDPLLRALRE